MLEMICIWRFIVLEEIILLMSFILWLTQLLIPILQEVMYPFLMNLRMERLQQCPYTISMAN